MTGTTLDLSGAVTSVGLTSTAAVTGTTLDLTGAVTTVGLASTAAMTGTTLALTGALTGTTATLSGAVTAAGLTSSAAVTGTTLDLSGAASVSGLTSSAAITGTSATLTGSISIAGLTSTSTITGTIVSASGVISSAGLTSSAIITASAGVLVTGTVTANGAALTSDRRYKKEIVTLGANSRASILDMLKDIRGVSYTWRRAEFPDRNFDSHTHYGFIAQELEETFPDLIGTDERGWKAVRYNGMIPILVEALKQVTSELRENKQKIKNLEEMVEILKNSVSEVEMNKRRIKALEDLLLSNKAQEQRTTREDEVEDIWHGATQVQANTVIAILAALLLLKLIEILRPTTKKLSDEKQLNKPMHETNRVQEST